MIFKIGENQTPEEKELLEEYFDERDIISVEEVKQKSDKKLSYIISYKSEVQDEVKNRLFDKMTLDISEEGNDLKFNLFSSYLTFEVTIVKHIGHRLVIKLLQKYFQIIKDYFGFIVSIQFELPLKNWLDIQG